MELSPLSLKDRQNSNVYVTHLAQDIIPLRDVWYTVMSSKIGEGEWHVIDKQLFEKNSAPLSYHGRRLIIIIVQAECPECVK
jgi:hypothetical protein